MVPPRRSSRLRISHVPSPSPSPGPYISPPSLPPPSPESSQPLQSSPGPYITPHSLPPQSPESSQTPRSSASSEPPQSSESSPPLRSSKSPLPPRSSPGLQTSPYYPPPRSPFSPPSPEDGGFVASQTGDDLDVPTALKTMHELFLTAAVTEYDRTRALQILQGYCAMSPVPVLRRRLYFSGSLTQSRTFDPAFVAAQGQKGRTWNALQEQMVRQAYTVVLLYDVKRDQFPTPDTPAEERPVIDCDATPGSLLWTDLPDPAGSRPVNTRLTMSIDAEKGLCNMLESSSYKFKGESIEEGYRFVHEHVVIYLTRTLIIPDEPRSEEKKATPPTIHKTMPPFTNLTPYDAENKWVMTVSLQVMAASDLENMQKGTEELMKIKSDFEGLFDLQIRDRHIFDTRVRA